MALIADALLALAAVAAAFYCFMLGRRVKAFGDLETGVGGAVTLLSAQVDELRTSLDEARQSAMGSADSLEQLTERAERLRAHLELQMVAMNDLAPPEPREPPQPVAEKPGEPLFMRRQRSA